MGKGSKALTTGQAGEVMPPVAKRLNAKPPVDLSDVKAIRREMARIYRFQFDGKIFPEDATKLVFILMQMVQAIKAETELAQITSAYMDAWSGVTITAPAGAEPLLAAPPHAEIIPPGQQSEENHVEVEE